MNERAPSPDLPGLEPGYVNRVPGKCCAMGTLALTIAILSSGGCTHQRKPAAAQCAPAAPLVVVVAPVLNLSNDPDWDRLKVTDIVASEFQSFPGVVIIPVNRTLAALALRGQSSVETPDDALELARDLEADATVVTAVTEYNPYDPPIVGLVMQWYAPAPSQPPSAFDPVSASRQASEVLPATSASRNETASLLQVQRVYNAADDSVLAEVRSYAAQRTGNASPYDWRLYVKSQGLFVRYCCWSTIRSMLLARERYRAAPRPDQPEPQARGEPLP